ncbi:FecR family protein [Gaoshiqia sp. Z1-71]|uniref:FecR family protein n=1 Tax=Gaoshiqia hydrogeniformans TaxID=3290090 RepID=UPI003BF8AD31
MNHQTFLKMLLGQVSEQEKEVFFEELNHNQADRQEYIRLKKLWDVQQISEGKKLSEQRKAELFQEFWHSVQPESKTKSKKLHPGWYKYAAILIVALVSGFFLNELYKPAPAGTCKQFYSEQGSISRVTLDDGSVIWLNSGTTLSLTEKKGEVLASLEGEAFFDIKHDERRVFIVNINNIKIRDLGTRFNVSAYPDDEVSRTTLLEGAIAVLDEHDREIRSLEVNQTFSYRKPDSSYQLEKIDPGLVTAWTENKFVFIDKPLAEICKEIEKWYGVSVVINDEALREVKYTSVIRRTTTVKQLLDMLKLTTELNYTIDDQEEKGTTIYLNK